MVYEIIPIKWVGFHPLYNLTKQGFFRGSSESCSFPTFVLDVSSKDSWTPARLVMIKLTGVARKNSTPKELELFMNGPVEKKVDRITLW